MWIRTQDKMYLRDCKNISISDKGDERGQREIIEGSPFDEYLILGIYSTKERALEVLDEIEQYIVGKIIIPTNYLQKHDITNEFIKGDLIEERIEHLPRIYQMPKE